MLGDLGKLIVAKGFKKLPKVQKIARSGHTGRQLMGRLLQLQLPSWASNIYKTSLFKQLIL